MDKLHKYLNDIAELFGYGYNEEFFSYLKSISKPNNQVCNKSVEYGEGGWKCEDCEVSTNLLICNDCFSKSKEKHKGHKVLFMQKCNGFCDCGEPTSIVKESFCPDHQGPFTNMNDLMSFIRSSIDEKLLNNINPLLNKIFLLFIEKINILYNNDNNNINIEENINIENELFNMIDELISFCSHLYENNLSLFYFVLLKFTENFPFDTNHKCFNYNEENNLITVIKENQLEKHKCICPFFQVLIYLLMKRETKNDSEMIFSLFIQNYKIMIITSLSFIHSFTMAHTNDNLKVFRGLGYQLLNYKLCELLYEEKNQYFFENFYSEIYNKVKEYLELKLYDQTQEILFNLLLFIKDFPKTKLINKIKSNLKIHSNIIDIVCLINNLNIFENKTKFTEFQRNGYLMNLLNCEIYTLNIVIFLSHLIDFNNLESVKFIFNKLITKILEYKKYKENLSDKIYSHHIVYIRYYSIFLNRFCFNYSFQNNCDLLDSYEYFQKIIPESKEINSFLFKELINFFGFIISQKYSFFSYYGEGMNLFYINYFSSRIYINCDITLMKYLLTLPDLQNDLNIDKILEYSNIDLCNNILINLKEEELNNNNENLNLKLYNEKRNLEYINSVLEFLLIIVRDNMSMINLAFKSYEKFKMKYKDEVYEKLLIKEKFNFENILKNQINMHILGNNNLIKREDCIELYHSFKENLDIKLIDNLLKENCEETILSNHIKQFSLKKKVFPFCDIDYLVESNERTNAIKYIIDFQSNYFNLLNTYILEPLSIQKKFYKRIYDSFFNKNNKDKFINFYHNIISNTNYPILTDVFFFNFSKILCFYIKSHNNDNNIDHEFKNKLLNEIKNNKLEGTNAKLFEYVKNLLLNKNIINEQNNEISYKNKNLKDRFKKKFNEQNQIIMKKLSSSKEIEFEEENISSEIEEICIYCRQPLNYDLNNYNGKICYLIRDYFIDILRNKEQKLRKKSTRIVTCNHKIHFNCYSKFVIKYIDFNLLKNGFPCPLCKKLSNIMICDFTALIQNDKNFLKGLIINNEDNKDFYNDDENNIIQYQNLILYNKNFFEEYCSKLLKNEILIKDINSDIDIVNQIFNYIINDFETFIIYYNITNYKKEQINIWRSILFTIRLLCKYKLINITDFIITKFKLIYKNIKNYDFNYLQNIDISFLINEILIYFFILYDLNDKNKKEIKDIFQNYILIYLFIYIYLKNNPKMLSVEEFLAKKELFKNIFDIYILKYKIFLLLFDNEDKKEEPTFEDIIKNIKSNENLKIIINNISNLNLKEQNLDIPKLHIIDLPENFIDFSYKYMKIDCNYCHNKSLNYYVCLICGSKICNSKECVAEINSKGKKEYSLIEHSKICGGGNILFISNKDSEIIYLLKRKFINSGIFVYINSYGEYVNNYYLNDNYILNKLELEKSIQIFLDLTYRKQTNIILNI